jgi:molybdate transport system permease protein
LPRRASGGPGPSSHTCARRPPARSSSDTGSWCWEGSRLLSREELEIVGFSLATAAGATLLILPPGVLAALALARYQGPGKGALETLLSLPLVLPPTAVGLVLLEAWGRRAPLGGWLASHGIAVVFTWKAVVLAMAVMSFPLLVRSARTAFEEVDPRLVGLARTLGCGPLAAFRRVTLPLAWRGLLAGVVLAFSRALGEFGATVMVAGNIPGRTQTLALAIFHDNQLGRDDRAFRLAFVTTALAFAALWTAEAFTRRRSRRAAA